MNSFSPESNLRTPDRTIILEKMDGKSTLSSTGMVDNRLFTGEQTLKMKQDPQTCLWTFQYTNTGLLPGGLEGKFTSFSAGMRHATEYFARRNIKISAVKD
jgi:hypothetical protein